MLKISFKEMVQINDESGTKRPIRRTVIVKPVPNKAWAWSALLAAMVFSVAAEDCQTPQPLRRWTRRPDSGKSVSLVSAISHLCVLFPGGVRHAVKTSQ